MSEEPDGSPADGPDGQNAGDGARKLDEDAAWREIVENYGEHVLPDVEPDRPIDPGPSPGRRDDDARAKPDGGSGPGPGRPDGPPASTGDAPAQGFGDWRGRSPDSRHDGGAGAGAGGPSHSPHDGDPSHSPHDGDRAAGAGDQRGVEPGAAPPGRPRGPSAPRWHDSLNTPATWDDEGHFVPPDPPPLPPIEPRRRLAWIGVLGVPAFMLVMVAFGWNLPGWVMTGLVAGFVGGFVYLVWTMSRTGRDDGPYDDGAVL